MRLSELKSRYVSMAAHDLRNPLAVIQSTNDVVRKYGGSLTDEQKQAKHDIIQTSIRVMVDLLDDILTIGQIDSGKLSFNPAPMDVLAFCQNIVAEIKEVTGTHLHIDFSSTGDSAVAHMDAKLLRHILSNLLSNAIKYSPDEKPVMLWVSRAPDHITFHIQDQGIGIPEVDQGRLFEAFHRASNANQVPGTGLGLAIVKQSVERHGGTITFTSKEGIGTTFSVTLPTMPIEKHEVHFDEENIGN
jgi:signal transduction histidine kinase